MITSKQEPSLKNIKFPAESAYGELEITINLSKPEKDPKQIAAEREAAKVDYPTCMLCMENEGYRGRLNYLSPHQSSNHSNESRW